MTERIRLVTAGRNEGLFNQRPIKIDGFELRHMEAVAVGKPSIKEWQNAFALACASSESSPYWIGDLLCYADSRAEWREKLDQAKSITGLAEQTLHNLGHICRKVAPEERELSPSVEHSAVAAKLPKAEQRKWLKKAKTEGWNKREFRLELQASQRRGIIEGQAEIAGMFRVWLVDCPWIYGDREPSGVEMPYLGMTIDQLCAMGPTIQAHTMKQAVMFFWVTAPMLYENPGPREVIEAFGFKPKTGGVWDKVDHNYGNYLSIRHEHLIIATRGSCTPDRPTPMFDSVFTERKSDVHSEKPGLVYKMIERLYDGPYVEMFARERRQGWTTYGNQILEEIAEPKRKSRA